MDKKYSRGTWISFLLHVIIAACLLNLHSVNMLVPSRSDGMEVEVISPPDVVKQRYVPVKAPQYNVQNTNNADVKLKQPDTTLRYHKSRLLQHLLLRQHLTLLHLPLVLSQRLNLRNLQLTAR